MARTNINRQIWPIVVGHRGASATYPENTLASFEGAIADVQEKVLAAARDYLRAHPA